MIQPDLAGLLVLATASYFVGAIPWGWLLVRLLHNRDLRTVGSGNIGATNAGRVLGPVGGVAVLLLDGLKGTTMVVWAGWLLGPTWSATAVACARVLCGLAALLGHNYPVYLGFRGGKGIATTFGVMLAISPLATFVAALVWGGLVRLTGYASVGSLAAVLAFPLVLTAHGALWPYQLFAWVACAMAFVRHGSNLRRLAAGSENKLGSPAASVHPSKPTERAEEPAATTVEGPPAEG
jgi:acyl phosphate:glycerol-3-phosphate acyltransferase